MVANNSVVTLVMLIVVVGGANKSRSGKNNMCLNRRFTFFLIHFMESSLYIYIYSDRFAFSYLFLYIYIYIQIFILIPYDIIRDGCS